eukprot:GSChrysophyteH1.ASY1.ANO1.2874.1 assembled CDS
MSYSNLGDSAFRNAERAFKKCNSIVDALNLGAIDFECHDASSCAVISRSTEQAVLGRKCIVHEMIGHDGLYVLKGALSTKQQKELAYCALNESLSPPNRTNLHCHYSAEDIETKLQNIWLREGPELDHFDVDVTAKVNGGESEPRRRKRRGGSSLNEGPRLPPHLTLSKVRWATLGYQYDWTARSYHKEQFVPFPQRVGDISRIIAEVCEAGFTMKPEAGIVNFYPVGQVMGGHVDDGEEARECPVVSYSLGPPCVFLVGGTTKDVAPTALLLRSGDVLVLGGTCRLKFHGIPKVFVSDGPPASLGMDTVEEHVIHRSDCAQFLDLQASDSDSCCICGGASSLEVERTLKVLACARVNVNLRQVYRTA